MKMMTKMIESILNLAISKTAKNTYFVFLGNLLGMIFAFIFTVLLVRLLSISDFGYFSALLSFLLITSDFADIGIGSSLSSFLPTMETVKERLFSFLKTAFFSQFIVASTLMIVIFLSSPLLSNLIFHDESLSYLLRIISLGVFSSILFNFFLFTLLARQKFFSAAFYTTLSGAIRLIGLIFLMLLSLVSLNNIVLLQSIGQLILVFVGLKLVNIKFLRAKTTRNDLKRLLSFSIYLGVARGITAIAGKIDVLMLIALTNSIETGIYSTASRVISIYPLLSGSFSTVIAPKLATFSSFKEVKRFLFKVILATMGLILSVIIMIVIANPFMTILFGPDKGTPAYQVFQLLLVSMIFFVGSIPAVSLAIYYLKKPYILTINSVLQLIIVVLGNLYFIPNFGRFGAAYSLIVAYSTTLVLTSSMSFYHLMKRHG